MLEKAVRLTAVWAVLAALALAAFPADVAAHAALERSEPAAGTSATEPPTEIRVTFTEPLESAYSGADLLDGAGDPVPGVAVSISPANDHQLVLTLAAPLGDGNYTVAWRTLSAADGHTLQGYFGFAVGVAASGGAAALPEATARDSPRAVSRGLALLGLASLLAMAPMMVIVFSPVARGIPALEYPVLLALRRYAVAAMVLALSGSVLALAVQAATVAPDSPALQALAETIGTRYGQLWLLRLAVLTIVVVAVASPLWSGVALRWPALLPGSLVSLIAPLPFSLISHAAAQQDGQAAAVAADALHLAAASVWAGGLFMLALVLAPALRPLPPDERRRALRVAIPRFSVVGLASWGVMVLTGVYSAWLQVGSIEALRTTAYGQSLLLKLVLLVPVLLLAAFHLALGKGAVGVPGARAFAATIAAEALIVVAVLLVVGRLIGLEPAREALSARTPGSLGVPLSFATDEGTRTGQLTISPGAAGHNEFVLLIDGDPLPAGTEGVLRFTPESQDLGTQELILAMDDANAFRAAGSELAVPDDWRMQAIVRAIGEFSWATEVILPVGETAPRRPEPHPAPLLAPSAIPGMLAVALGVAALAAALAGSAGERQRALAAAAGFALAAVGSTLLWGSRVPEPQAILAAAPRGIAATPAASPVPSVHEQHREAHEAMSHHASPVADDALELPGSGTPIAGDGFTIALAASPAAAGPVDVVVALRADDGSALTGARVTVLSDMPGMEMGRTEIRAEEVDPGSYEAAFVPLGMPGEWRLSVRVSPRGAPTQVISFAVSVP